MKNSITYEQPLNERVRSFLRTEYLFKQVQHSLSKNSEYDIRNTLSALITLSDLVSRSDIKNDLIKELERYSGFLLAISNKSGVDINRLQLILDDINHYITSLRDINCQPGQALRNSDFIASIRQRSSIPGGTCNFDLPGYHYWLNNSTDQRILDFDNWLYDLKIIDNCVCLILKMLRTSTTPVLENAEMGLYQKVLDSSITCQLIRVILPSDSKFYPEISGGKQRFTIRFMEQTSTLIRPSQVKDNIEFELHCCIL